MVGDEGLPTFTDPATSAKAKGRTRRPLLWTHGGAARSNPQGGHRCDPAAFDPKRPFAASHVKRLFSSAPAVRYHRLRGSVMACRRQSSRRVGVEG